MVPDWYCGAIGVQCERAYPEYIFDVSPDQWISLVQDAALVAVKGQPSSPPAIEMQPLRSNELKTEKLPPGKAASGGRAELKVDPRLIKWDMSDVGPEDSVSFFRPEQLPEPYRPELHRDLLQNLKGYTWADRPPRSELVVDVQGELRLIAGQLVSHLDAPDPNKEDTTHWLQMSNNGVSTAYKRAFLKWADSHREAYFEGKDDIGAFNEWKETLGYYFATSTITNVCAQAWLATATFKRTGNALVGH